MKNGIALVTLGVVAGFAASAVADNEHDHDRGKQQRTFRASLESFNEVPAVSSRAEGQFYAVVNKEGTAFTYWLSYSGMSANVSQAHIHFGNHHTNGMISVWLCQTAGTPAPAGIAAQTPMCEARATRKPITATIDASDVIGPAGQGIAPGEFAELIAAIRAGAAYANVHSNEPAPAVSFPGGEIRGQID
jgi:hypothetical protein